MCKYDVFNARVAREISNLARDARSALEWIVVCLSSGRDSPIEGSGSGWMDACLHSWRHARARRILRFFHGRRRARAIVDVVFLCVVCVS